MKPEDQGQSRTLAVQVRRLTARAGLLAKEAGLDADAALLQLESDRQTKADAAVVVVGETKRGKSSLINALVGRRGLLPVDSDVATSSQILVVAAAPEFARVYRSDASEAQDIPVGDIGAYATAGASAEGMVSSVLVGIDSPFLREQVSLVDTPGASGFSAVHAERTIAALTMADALLFVTDASTPITLPELRFLERVTERVATVVFVMTKVDLHRNWQQIVTENWRLLRQYAPAFASEIHPVASPLATVDDPDLDPSDVRELEQESGVPALRQVLVEAVARRATVLRALNACRLVRSAMGRVAETESIRLRAAQHDPELEAQLLHAQAKLQELTSAGANWRRTLSDDFQSLQAAVHHMLQLQTSRASGELVSVIEKTAEAEMEEAVSAFLRDHVEALWLRSRNELTEGARRISEKLIGELAVEAGVIDLPPAPPMSFGALTEVELPGASAASPTAVALDRISVMQSGYMMGTMTATLLGAGSMAPFLIPGLIVAGIIGRVREKEHRRRESRQRAIETARRLLADARSEISVGFGDQFINVRRVVDDEIAARLHARATELKRLLAEQQRIVTESRTQADQIRKQATERLRQAEEQTAIATRLQADVHAQPA